MRTICYAALPGVGPREASYAGTLAGLAREIPYLLVRGVLPPVRVLNEVLSTGEHDARMSGGCRWEPFESLPGEHEELTTEPGMPVAEPSGWVWSNVDWTIWMMEVWHGVPYDEHRRLSREYEEAATAYREARARVGEDAPLEDELLGRYAEQAGAGRRLSEFVNRYVRSDD